MTPFSAGVRGRSVELMIFARIITEKSTFLGVQEQSATVVPRPQQIKIAAHVIAADDVENDVDAAASGARTPRPPSRWCGS